MTDTHNPKDWLGYDDYAAALWQRIQHEFAARPVKPEQRLPTGDPLVIGVYGEWGSGKTRLLELVHDKVHEQAMQTLALRALDPHAFDKELSITLPVWFHPWKYEHEPALAVPLLMHLSDALRTYLKDGQTFEEAVRKGLAEKSTAVVEWTADAKQKVKRLEKLLKGIHAFASHSATQTAAAVAGGFVGFGQQAKEAVQWVGETAGKLSGADGAEPAPESAAQTAQEAKPDSPGKPPTEPRFTADGSFYYNVHRHLRQLSLMTPLAAKPLGFSLKRNVRLNFVVFVDDLDRCLPEKAVQTLEIIKTLLNVESFAFVVALDDEVIERGIAHRYRDYRFEGAKPEMPITGFEYLEKIIHLPFRLPALTRPQAQAFIQRLEDHLSGAAGAEGLPRLWFRQQLSRQETGSRMALSAEGLPGESTEDAAATWVPTPLVNMLLDCFDIPAPRKLARAVEALNHVQRVLQARNTPLTLREQWPATVPRNAPPDAAVLLAFCVLQLFAPELFRLLRRRPLIWRQWMMAYLESHPFSPAFGHTRSDDRLDIEVSDEALYDWAARGNESGGLMNDSAEPEGLPKRLKWGGSYAEWMRELGASEHIKGQRRFYTEQVRLPFARAICEHRDIGRLAFDPLRLGAALIATTGWRSHAQVVDDQLYHQLFSEAAVVAEALTPGNPNQIASTTLTADGMGGRPDPHVDTRKRRAIPLNLLRELITTDDSGARRSLVERLNLQADEALDDAAMKTIGEEAKPPAALDKAFETLVLLAPYLPKDKLALLGTPQWPTLPRWRVLQATELESNAFAERMRELGLLARHGLLEPLGLQILSKQGEDTIVTALHGTELEPKQRAELAALLAPFGDSRRFAFAKDGPRLPTRRASGKDDHDSRAHEPIPGFVRVPAGPFTRGEKEQRDNPPQTTHIAHDFYIARTLTTVEQWQAFIEAGGYAKDEFWDKQGHEWRKGTFDSQVENETYQRWLAGRPATGQNRLEPRLWRGQLESPTTPVTGICWFEARAYARWLNLQLGRSLQERGLAGYGVRLPTEDQWERAARADSATEAGLRKWSHGGGEAALLQQANLMGSIAAVSPVGAFPHTPLNLYDITGNVWEWQDNLYLPKQPASSFVRIHLNQVLKTNKELSQCDMPALRGGSWGDDAGNARCAFRDRYLPGNDYSNVGLRMVLSLAD